MSNSSGYPAEHELERMHLADAARLLSNIFVTVEREHVSCYCPTCDVVREQLAEAERLVRI